MARPRKKKRTQPGPGAGTSAKPAAKGSQNGRSPKSMVIRIGAGEVGPSVSQLVKDVRAMMEPETAGRLRERKSNKLRDYTSMTGPLGVTHLLLFSRSPSGNTNLRIALTPRGPTLHFKVERYSLCKDVRRALKHPSSGVHEHQTPPLLVMNNFLTHAEEKDGSHAGAEKGKEKDDGPAKAPRHLETLATTVFQSLFPPIAPQTTPLSSIRRILLLNREVPTTSSTSSAIDNEIGTFTINLRHYAISTQTSGLSRGIRKLRAAERRVSSNKPDQKASARKHMPDLGKLQDVSEFLLDPANAGGFTSGSESEAETDGEVEVLAPKTTKVLNRRKWEQLQRRKQAALETKAPRRQAEADEDNENDGVQDGAEKNDDASQLNSESIGNVEKRRVKLTELGPRMKLRLVKIEEGVCEGRVMWHEFIQKSRAEEKELEQRWAERRQIKEQRKKKQREDILRKRKENAEAKTNGTGGEGAEDDELDEWESDLEDLDEDIEMEDEVEVET